MEDDLLDGIDTSDNNETKTEAYSYAEFEFALTTSAAVQTRSSVSADGEEIPDKYVNTTEGSISSCYIAVLDKDGNVVASDFYSTYNTDKNSKDYDFGYKKDGAQIVKKHMTIKVYNGETPELTFFAVANLQAKLDGIDLQTQPVVSDADGFIDCKSLTEIQNKLIGKSHINIFVKKGSYKLLDSHKLVLKESALTHSDELCNKIVIPVSQVTAAVQLQEFKIRNPKGEVNDALKNVVSVELINLKNKTYLNQGISVNDDKDNFDSVGALKVGDDNTFNGSYVLPDYLEEGKTNPKYNSVPEIRFYTYRNETTDDDKKTALKIVYTLEKGGAEYTKIIKIKSPKEDDGFAEKVEAGKLYKLYVTVSEISGDNVEYVVNDWIPNTIDLGEINGSKN